MRVSIVTIAIAASAPVMAANPLGDQRPAVRPVLSKPAVEISTGFEYQEGKYGTGQKVETISIPTSVRVTTGRFQFSATLPYVRIDAPGNVVGGGGVLGLPILIDPNQTATRTRREGLGDLKLGAAYTVPSTIVGLSLLGQVKLPTASNVDNLGTGETDYSLGAELSKRLGGVIPFIGVSYTIPGVPKGYDLRNSLSLRGGIATMLSPQVRGYIPTATPEARAVSSPTKSRYRPVSTRGFRTGCCLVFSALQGCPKDRPTSARAFNSA